MVGRIDVFKQSFKPETINVRKLPKNSVVYRYICPDIGRLVLLEDVSCQLLIQDVGDNMSRVKLTEQVTVLVDGNRYPVSAGLEVYCFTNNLI